MEGEREGIKGREKMGKSEDGGGDRGGEECRKGRKEEKRQTDTEVV